MKPHLLIIDGDREFQALLRRSLSPHYEIATATDRGSALDAFQATKPPVVLLDLGLLPSRGVAAESLATLAALLAVDAQVKVIMIGGAGDRDAARRALSSGAYDHAFRPVDPEELKLVLRRAFHLARLEHDLRDLRSRSSLDAFEGLVGDSPAMQAVFETIRKVAPTEAPVLLSGERGTGKELTARAIHRLSLRSNGPFVALDCSAVPGSLIETELFGREEDSPPLRKGKIELSHGGTLLLNQVGSLPRTAQARLLRFLQDLAIPRRDSEQGIPVDSRVIVATTTDLEPAVKAGAFRDDLFYHLAVVRIPLPPLRERGEDVVLLAMHFLATFRGSNGKSGVTLSPEALRTMRHFPWPGNVRELQSRIRRAVIMCDERQITPADLELGPLEATITLGQGTLREARERLEREMIRQALRRSAGRISTAAAELGISRPTLYDLMQKLGLERQP